MTYDIDKDYDAKLKAAITKRINRAPLTHEIINSDNDSDLVNEVLWQIIVELHQRITALEKNSQGVQ